MNPPEPPVKVILRPLATFKVAIITTLWLVAVVTGSAVMLKYAATPGSEKAGPQSWPTESAIMRHFGQPSLVLFIHPKCPCSRATLGELERIMSSQFGKVDAQVVFLQPEGTSEDWAKTDLWAKAQSIPGVTARLDTDAVESRRFHVETSGQALYYSAQGDLVFQGGITASRGHAGDNAGSSAILSLLGSSPTLSSRTPVFGCGLFEPSCPEGVACTP